MLNLRGNLRRLREHRLQERLRGVFSRRLVRLMTEEFRRVGAAMREEPRSPERLHVVIEQHRHRLYTIFHSYYQQVMDAFGQRALKSMAERSKSVALQLETKARQSQYDQNVQAFVDRWTGKKVTQVSRTTQRKIADLVSEATTEGLSDADLADSIESLLKGPEATSRAETIARTETHAASQDASFSAAQSTGLDLMKRWVAVMDSRTREDHADANDQQVLMHEYFLIGPEENELMYPGDPSGDASEVINCRCVVVYDSSDATPDDAIPTDEGTDA